jgi:hypothetical protein
MTNAQLYLAVGLPITSVLTALVVSLAQISGIKSDIADLGAEMRDIRAELREIGSDIKLLTGKVYEMMK